MLARPTVSVFNFSNPQEVVNKIALPEVCHTPVRLDIVRFVHDQISKNIRQAHGVKSNAGMQHSAESWGTGRAVARIPRVGGSGTNRSGQGAFGNMCRKGRMFAPLKTWRRWHRKVNLKQKRHAIASALAASAITPLVIARGHRISSIPNLPLVVDDKVEGIEKTKDALSFLKRIGADEDVARVATTKALRPGIGKLRNKRFKVRRGPLVIYSNENANLIKSVRNVPGVDICNVHRLNLKQLAPGGHLGRFIIWTESAFRALNKIFGTYRIPGQEKGGYKLHRTVLENADIAKIINSNEIQSVVRQAKANVAEHIQKRNPLRNEEAMEHLNPYGNVLKRMQRESQDQNRKKRQEALAAKRGISKSLTKEQKTALKARKKASKAWINNVAKSLDDAYEGEEEQEEQK
jgi:large subunit ribosomal protein L4e